MNIDVNQDVSFDIGDEAVKFTSEGKVSVVDAIRAVTGSEQAGNIWDQVKEEHEDLLDHCERHDFQDNGATLVIDSDGWERLWELLPYYIFEER
jgi:hypothetical protein